MYPENARYTKEHEWIRPDGDLYVVGITAHAADQLGDVTYVELPEVGATVSAGDEAGAVESVKAASDVYAPVSGTIVETNATLDDAPETVNSSPHEDGWFFKLAEVDPTEFSALMDAVSYTAYLDELDH